MLLSVGSSAPRRAHPARGRAPDPNAARGACDLRGESLAYRPEPGKAGRELDRVGAETGAVSATWLGSAARASGELAPVRGRARRGRSVRRSAPDSRLEERTRAPFPCVSDASRFESTLAGAETGGELSAGSGACSTAFAASGRSSWLGTARSADDPGVVARSESRALTTAAKPSPTTSTAPITAPMTQRLLPLTGISKSLGAAMGGMLGERCLSAGMPAA